MASWRSTVGIVTVIFSLVVPRSCPLAAAESSDPTGGRQGANSVILRILIFYVGAGLPTRDDPALEHKVLAGSPFRRVTKIAFPTPTT